MNIADKLREYVSREKAHGFEVPVPGTPITDKMRAERGWTMDDSYQDDFGCDFSTYCERMNAYSVRIRKAITELGIDEKYFMELHPNLAIAAILLKVK